MAEKKPKAKKKSVRRGQLYEISEGKVKRKNKFCPKCGNGVFLAKHSDRWSCGKCGYTEFIKERR